jgi:hypothetical protein
MNAHIHLVWSDDHEGMAVADGAAGACVTEVMQPGTGRPAAPVIESQHCYRRPPGAERTACRRAHCLPPLRCCRSSLCCKQVDAKPAIAIGSFAGAVL